MVLQYAEDVLQDISHSHGHADTRQPPKEAFSKHLSLAATLKARFVTDVDRIVVENSLTKKNLNLAKESEIKEKSLCREIKKSPRFIGSRSSKFMF